MIVVCAIAECVSSSVSVCCGFLIVDLHPHVLQKDVLHVDVVLGVDADNRYLSSPKVNLDSQSSLQIDCASSSCGQFIASF